MSKVFTDVHIFMTAADQPVPSHNVKQNEQSDLYLKLIEEEYQELMDAVYEEDDTEICDACFDLMWVIIGYMHSRGWDTENIWDEGAQSNLAKIDRTSGKVLKRKDGKVMKPEGWRPPDFSKFVKSP